MAKKRKKNRNRKKTSHHKPSELQAQELVSQSEAPEVPKLEIVSGNEARDLHIKEAISESGTVETQKTEAQEKISEQKLPEEEVEKESTVFKKQALPPEDVDSDENVEMSEEIPEEPQKSSQSFLKLPENFGENLKKETIKILKKGAYYSLGILSVTAILVVFDLHSDNRIFPRTFLGPVALGYSSPDEAKKRLEQEINTYLNQPIVFIYNDWEIPLTLKELGVTFSVEQALRHLPKIDFAETNVFTLATGLLKEDRLPLEFSFDSEKVVELLENKFNLKNRRAQNATLVFEKKNIIVQPEKEGQILKSEKLLRDLELNLQNLANRAIVLELETERPQVTASQLEAKKEYFRNALNKPVKLLYEGKEWRFQPSNFTEVITFETKKAATFNNQDLIIPLAVSDDKEPVLSSQDNIQISDNIYISFKSPKVLDFIQKEISAQINKPTSEAKIYKNAEGKIIIEGKGQNGLTVLENRLIDSLNLAVTQGINRIQIPVHEDKANIEIADDLQKLGVKELLATGHSSFYGSSKNRRHNIDVGIEKYNGLLVAPGEEFSFNKILGPVDGSNGFVLEKVIKGDKAEMEYGGGICQVSSTLYRAALFAGLPITERSPHSWKVDYYGQVLGHGLDATIYPGIKDIKFLNDTGHHILIQAYVEDSHAYFKFYGTSDGRKATLDGPYGGGLHYTWYRDITKSNGETVRETIVSKYRPVPVTPPPTPPADPVQASVTPTQG